LGFTLVASALGTVLAAGHVLRNPLVTRASPSAVMDVRTTRGSAHEEVTSPREALSIPFDDHGRVSVPTASAAASAGLGDFLVQGVPRRDREGGGAGVDRFGFAGIGGGAGQGEEGAGEEGVVAHGCVGEVYRLLGEAPGLVAISPVEGELGQDAEGVGAFGWIRCRGQDRFRVGMGGGRVASAPRDFGAQAAGAVASLAAGEVVEREESLGHRG
jgi:hypothetical protein